MALNVWGGLNTWGASGTVPAAPFVVAVPGDAEISMSWAAVPNATGYKAFIDGTPTDVGNTTNQTYAGLNNGQQYEVYAVAYNSFGDSTDSNKVLVTPSAAAQPPQGVVTVDSVLTSFNAVSVSYSYSDSDQDGFEYRLDGGAEININNDNPFSVIGLTPQTAYTVEVRAYNADGFSAWSVPFHFTTEAEETNECYVGFISKIVDDPIDNKNGYNGKITDINGFNGSLCDDVCCS